MAFIRIKKIKGLDYYYLVRSQWDPDKKRSIQHIVKYLGSPENVSINDIPQEHRNNSKILSLLAINSKSQQEKNLRMIEMQDQIFVLLKNGNINRILEIAKNFIKQSSLSEFYDLILKPVMYEIGSLWEKNKLDISTEHMCSNIANEVIHLLNGGRKTFRNGNKILICTPDGEIHGLPCKVLESVLLEQGFNVFNLSPSVPSTSILEFIGETNSSMLLISVSFSENLVGALRLIKKINDRYDIPVLIGGFAINSLKDQDIVNMESENTYLHVMKNSTLDNVIKTIRSLISNIKAKYVIH